MQYRFGDFLLDLRRAELTRGGQPVALEPQVFDLLVLLVRQRDRVLTKDEIIGTIWHGRAVSDAALNSRISAVRRAIGDDGERQALVQTVRGRGFRFVAPAEEIGAPAARAAAPAAASPARSQVVRYCHTPDGVSIAYATVGSGPPLVKAANWLNHLEYDWTSPVWRDLFARLSDGNTFIRYDARGSGLSDREADDISLEGFFRDLESVVEATGLSRFALLGLSQGAAVAIRYAVAHPERVSRLILWGGMVRGRRRRGSAADAAQADALLTMIRDGWGEENSAFRKMFATLYVPNGSKEQLDWWTDLQRVATSTEMAVRTRQAIDDIDVSDLLPQLKMPVLVLHSEHESVVPLSEARRMASAIPDCQLVLLDSMNHVILPQEPDWERFVAEIKRFLAAGNGGMEP